MPEQTLRHAPPPLPATKADLATHMTYKRARTIIDDVQEVNALLWEDSEYQKYLRPVFNEEAITGSCEDDLFMAALMIKAKAREIGMESLANAKETAIKKALKRVLGGRYEGVYYKHRREAAEGNGQGSLLNEETT
jgi:hypothetical protein